MMPTALRRCEKTTKLRKIVLIFIFYHTMPFTMPFTFSTDDVRQIGQTLGHEPQVVAEFDEFLFNLSNTSTRQSLALTLANNVPLGGESGVPFTGTLVVAQTQHGYFELHNCTAFMVFEPDEIIFLSADDVAVSGMLVGKQCTCSMFVNVRRENLSANFAELDPRLLMSAMQLSVAEIALPAEEI
jgi:hypothetical protein